MRRSLALRHRRPAVAALRFGATVAALCMAFPAAAQDRPGQDEETAAPYVAEPPAPLNSQKSGNDQADKATGERQTREAVEGIEPMARISNRIPNRVQNRIRSRVDRDYRGLSTSTNTSDATQYTPRRTNPPRNR